MNLLRALSRLPLSMWARGLGAAVVLIAMLVFGLAIAAAAVVLVVVVVLAYKTRDWVNGLFRERRPAPAPVPVAIRRGPVSDADYTIVDRR